MEELRHLCIVCLFTNYLLVLIEKRSVLLYIGRSHFDSETVWADWILIGLFNHGHFSFTCSWRVNSLFFYHTVYFFLYGCYSDSHSHLTLTKDIFTLNRCF